MQWTPIVSEVKYDLWMHQLGITLLFFNVEPAQTGIVCCVNV